MAKRRRRSTVGKKCRCPSGAKTVRMGSSGFRCRSKRTNKLVKAACFKRGR